jgi:hypothetical protein
MKKEVYGCLTENLGDKLFKGKLFISITPFGV